MTFKYYVLYFKSSFLKTNKRQQEIILAISDAYSAIQLTMDGLWGRLLVK